MKSHPLDLGAEADLFAAELFGETDSPAEELPAGSFSGEEPFFGDGRNQCWKVVARPGSEGTRGFTGLRNTDLIVQRSSTDAGVSWRCVPAADVDARSIYRPGSDRVLRQDIAILRRVRQRWLPSFSVESDAEQTGGAERFYADLIGVPGSRLPYRGGVTGEALIEDVEQNPPAADPFRCAAANAVVVHNAVVTGMRAAETRSGEALTVDAVCASAPPNCPSPHAPLHGTAGAAVSNAAHFTGLDTNTVRTVEIAGLFGIDLRTVARANRPGTSVQVMPTAAPLQALSFVAISRSGSRAIHIGRETPRRVESWVDDQLWLCLPFVPGLTYRLFKRRFWEASFHRQWGTLFTISWIAGLSNFYRDVTGQSIGVGDVSHVVGEAMTDHGSHRLGKDVDCYVLENPPAGGNFPIAFWCSGTRNNLELRQLGMPAAGAVRPEYTVPRGAAIADPRHTTLLGRYATILAYCLATQAGVEAAVWHGAPALAAGALTIAQNAWDATVRAGRGTAQRPGWRATWGFGPTTRAEIVAARANLFIGDGSASYNRDPGWPLHQDHIHVRLR